MLFCVVWDWDGILLLIEVIAFELGGIDFEMVAEIEILLVGDSVGDVDGDNEGQIERETFEHICKLLGI